MKHIFFSLIALLMLGNGLAQELDRETIKTIQSTVKMDDYTRAMQNALSNNDVNKLARKLEKYG